MQGLSGFVFVAAKKKKRSQNEIGRAFLPLWCGERLLRQGIFTVLSVYSSVECAGVKRICFCCAQKKKRSQNEIGRAFLPPWCGERLLRQEAFGFAPTTTVAGEILASDAGVSRTYEDTLRVRPTGFLFEDPVCSISVLPQRQTVCRMTGRQGAGGMVKSSPLRA